MKKERKFTTAVKYALLGYIVYIAAYGCHSLYHSVKEKAKAGIEWISNTKDDISHYVRPDEQTKLQPSRLEKMAGE